MPLEVARQRLAHALEGWLYNRIPAQGRLLTELAHEWYEELKKFEAEESFSRAFQDKRMTMRLLNAASDRSANDYQRIVSSHKVEKQGNGTLKKIGETEVFLSGGLKGMKDRMTPGSFDRPTPGAQSMKNKLGLHDLSARLLDPRFSISDQGFNIEKVKHAIFVPVPPQEDHKLFYNLNLSAKGELSHDSDFVNAILYIRARLTRIKLAEPTDMGSSLVVMKDLFGRERVRYGHTGVVTGEKNIAVTTKTIAEQLAETPKLKKVTEANKDERPKHVPLTPEQIRARIETAWRYQSVLKTTSDLGTNEITIAYREYTGEKFPLITDWPDRGVKRSSHQIQEGPFIGQYLNDDGTIQP